MNNTTYIKFGAYATLAGVLFSGYLSGTKFFAERCAFNESCALFMGYPACYVGFSIFAVMFVFSLLSVFKVVSAKMLSLWLTCFSFLGVVFAGYIVVQENFAFTTCTLGLLFYLLIFIISTRRLFTH